MHSHSAFMKKAFKRKLLLLFSLLVLMLAGFVASCSEPQLPTWNHTADSGFEVFLATTDIAKGEDRFAFSIATPIGILQFPVLDIQFKTPTGKITERGALFYPFPSGIRGVYVANTPFDEIGDWQAELSFPFTDGQIHNVVINFTVTESGFAIATNSVAPRVQTKTIGDVDNFNQLSTASQPYLNLYQRSLHELLNNGKPTVIAISSPAFCTNAICGPQDDVLNMLYEDYSPDINFVHVDLYNNPQEIAGDLSAAKYSEIVNKWNLQSADEWTFILSNEGVVKKKYENFASYQELKEDLRVLFSSLKR